MPGSHRGGWPASRVAASIAAARAGLAVSLANPQTAASEPLIRRPARMSSEATPPPDHPGEQQTGSCLRHQPKFDERDRELRGGFDIHQIAMEEHGEPHADGESVDGCHQRNPNGRECAQEPDDLVEVGTRSEVGQVIAGGEDVAYAGDKDGADSGVRVCFEESVGHASSYMAWVGAFRLAGRLMVTRTARAR